MSSKSKDDLVAEYQKTGCSDDLFKAFENFLNKYHHMFSKQIIDFDNYDIRCFLACYIKEKHLANQLRGKYHTSKIKNMAYQVLKGISVAFRHHCSDDIMAELVIPFLICARKYQAQGKSFHTYLYHSYRYNLKRHIDNKLFDMMDQEKLLYFDVYEDERDWYENVELKRADVVEIHMDEGLELSHPDWINGVKASYPFNKLKRHERYILTKYYYEKKKDKEIARLLPYNPKSIHRIRMRLVKKLHQMQKEGDLKCIRV